MRRRTLLLPLLFFGVSCEFDPFGPDFPSDAVPIWDGAHGGNPHFFFLPPLVDDPKAKGVPNTGLAPVVEICALADDVIGCDDPQPGGLPLVFTMDSPPPQRVQLTGDHYTLPWRTSGLDADTNYRIRVFAVEGGEELGHIDIDLVSGGKGKGKKGGKGKKHDPYGIGGPVEVQAGSTVPVRFRIEEGALCTFGLDCVEAVIGEEGGTVLTPEEFAGVEIPEGALDGPVAIIIERVDVSVEPCLPTDFIQAEGCYRYDTQPPLSEVQESGLDEFNEDVIVGVCLDPDVLALPEHHQYALYKFDPDDPEPELEELPSAPAPFLDCTDFSALALDEGSPFLRLARAGWERIAPVARLLGPSRAYAVNLGFGGVVRSFSQIGWLRGMTFEVIQGEEQSGPAGATLEIEPAVQVTATHWDPAELESAPVIEGVVVTFTFTDPDETVTVVQATTNSDGVASVPWVLGPTPGVNTLSIGVATTQAVAIEATAVSELNAIVRVADEPDDSGIPTFPTIPEAFANVQSGGIIFVAEGVWPATGLTLNRPVTIEAESLGEGEYVAAVIEPPAEAFAFTVQGIAEGAVVFRGLTFEGGYGAIQAMQDYASVLVEDCTFETDRGVVADPAADEPGQVRIENSAFQGGTVGVHTVGANTDVIASTFNAVGLHHEAGSGEIRGNTLTDCTPEACIWVVDADEVQVIDNELLVAFPAVVASGITVYSPSFPAEERGSVNIEGNRIMRTGGVSAQVPLAFGIRVGFNAPGAGVHLVVDGNTIQGASNGIGVARSIGAVRNNTISDCRFACINIGFTTGDEVIAIDDNRIEMGAEAANGIFLQVSAGSEPPNVQNNEIVGLIEPTDPADALSYTPGVGIGMTAPFNATDVSAQASNNLVRNLATGMQVSGSGVLEGRDNRIENVYRGLQSTAGNGTPLNAIRFSDIDAFIGLSGSGQFAATCNWWGTPNGPNVVEDIPSSAYSPFAAAPIAGTEANDCID